MTITVAGSAFEVQRIFCIGRNYSAHAAELGNAVPAEPVVFMKPPTAIVRSGEPVRLPRGRGSVHHEAEVVLLVGKDDARTVDDLVGVTLGLDLTLRDEQVRLKSAGLPWELAKAFDGSAPLGEFVPWTDEDIEFSCHVNGALRQHGNTARMLFPPSQLLAFLASRFRLRQGDLVFTGTPEGVAPLAEGDSIEVASKRIGRFDWRLE